MLPLYMDVHVDFAITIGLRRRQVDVLTAQEDGTTQVDDEPLLDRAAALNRVLFTQDEDFLTIAGQRQASGLFFAGLVYGHQQAATIGQYVRDLELVCKVFEPEDMANQIQYLPLD
jgi:predicted nuclease of predicted toxin-antitoxin system